MYFVYRICFRLGGFLFATGVQTCAASPPIINFAFVFRIFEISLTFFRSIQSHLLLSETRLVCVIELCNEPSLNAQFSARTHQVEIWIDTKRNIWSVAILIGFHQIVSPSRVMKMNLERSANEHEQEFSLNDTRPNFLHTVSVY